MSNWKKIEDSWDAESGEFAYEDRGELHFATYISVNSVVHASVVDVPPHLAADLLRQLGWGCVPPGDEAHGGFGRPIVISLQAAADLLRQLGWLCVPPGEIHTLGVDYSKDEDYTVAVQCAHHPDGTFEVVSVTETKPARKPVSCDICSGGAYYDFDSDTHLCTRCGGKS